MKNKFYNPKANKLKAQKGTTIFLSVFLGVFILYGATLIFPALWALWNALKTGEAFYESSFAAPDFKNLQWQNFKNAFIEIEYNNMTFIDMFFNSVWMTSLRVVASLAASTLSAYALARFRFPGKSLLYSIAIIIQVVPIIGTGGATYKFLFNARMVNNPLLIWLAWAGGFDFSFIVLYGYFKSISGTYAEAAGIDGASQFKVMLKIMLPQAMPAIASLAIMNFITAWNDYQTPMLYMRKYPTMSLGIYSFQRTASWLSNGTPVYFCAVLLSMLPVCIIFVCTQKMIMTNVTAGGLKG